VQEANEKEILFWYWGRDHGKPYPREKKGIASRGGKWAVKLGREGEGNTYAGKVNFS